MSVSVMSSPHVCADYIKFEYRVYLSIFIYFVTLKTEYYAKGCVRENKSKKFKVRIKRMTVRNENR